MAEGFLKSFDNKLAVYSAGTQPAEKVNLNAIKVMAEAGIDISHNIPKLVDEFLSDEFDYVITVCDGAKESCPMFSGKVGKRLHIGFDDPAEAKGTEEEILNKFRKIRDQIRSEFHAFFRNIIKDNKPL
jgi:arsenate reductase